MTEREWDYESLKEKALRLLEYRTHSGKEIFDKLKRLGAETDDIEKVISFLTEYKLINDEDYALRYSRDLRNLKKLGKNRVRQELKKKGISDEYIENAIEAIDWEETDELYRMIEKKLGGDFEKKSIERCIRYFIYKGYGFDEIKKTIEAVKTEAENGV